MVQEGFFGSEISGRSNDAKVFWEGNCPLYSLLTGYWMRLFGFSLFAARSFNILLYALAVVLVGCGLTRLGYLGSNAAIAAIPALMFMCYGVEFMYRQCRYEPLCVVECSAVFCILTVRRDVLRRVLLLVVGALVPWSGFPAVAWLAGAFGAGVFVFGRRVFIDGLCVGCGVASGLASMALFYWSQGGLWSFISHVTHVQGRVPFTVAHRVRMLVHGVLQGRGGLALWCGVAVSIGGRLRTGNISFQSPGVVAAAVAIAGAIVQAVVTSRVYDWTVLLPLAVGVSAELGDRAGIVRSLPEWRAVLGCVAVASLGLPSTLLATAYEWNERDYSRVVRFVESHVSSDDFCFSDITGYFPVKRIAQRIRVDFGTLYTVGIWDNVETYAAAKTPFTVMVVRSERADRTIKEFGGGWEVVGRMPEVPPTWQNGSTIKSVMKAVLDVVYPPPLDADPNKRVATDRMYDLVVLRPIGRTFSPDGGDEG